MRLNYSGNSHTHRMLSAVLPKMVRDSIAFQDIIKFATDDSLKILKDGVRGPGGNIYRMAVVQVVGDWMFLQKAANLERSYANVEKRPRMKIADLVGFATVAKRGSWKSPSKTRGRLQLGGGHCLPKMIRFFLHGQPCWIYLTSLTRHQIFSHMIYGTPFILGLGKHSQHPFLLWWVNKLGLQTLRHGSRSFLLLFWTFAMNFMNLHISLQSSRTRWGGRIQKLFQMVNGTKDMLQHCCANSLRIGFTWMEPQATHFSLWLQKLSSPSTVSCMVSTLLMFGLMRQRQNVFHSSDVLSWYHTCSWRGGRMIQIGICSFSCRRSTLLTIACTKWKWNHRNIVTHSIL